MLLSKQRLLTGSLNLKQRFLRYFILNQGGGLTSSFTTFEKWTDLCLRHLMSLVPCLSLGCCYIVWGTVTSLPHVSAKPKMVQAVKAQGPEEDCVELCVKVLTVNRWRRAQGEDNRTLKNKGVNLRRSV